MDYETMYGGGYVCSICGQWNRTSAICTHPTVVPDIKLKDMENKISTAEEYVNGILGKDQYPTDTTYAMIEFAKLHVEAALKDAAENSRTRTNDESTSIIVDKQSILNSYPLDNIK